jgi:GGDEF domain-containing protein
MMPSGLERPPADSTDLSRVERAMASAGTNLVALEQPLVDGLFPAAVLRGRAMVGRPFDPDLVVAGWVGKATRPTGSARYPWSMDPRFARLPAWIPRRETWRPWRPREAAVWEEWVEGRDLFSAGFLTPIELADIIELVSEVAASASPLAGYARQVLDEAGPKLRRDAAAWAQEHHAWFDTWALWAVSRRPRALALLHPFTVATAESYAATAIRTGSVVLGTRHPFHDEPLVSASAQLAAGLLALGYHPSLTGALATWIATQQRADGGFGDADGPSDTLATLVASELLASLDPAFAAEPAAAFLATRQRADGWWTAFGPETTWLTVEVTEALERSRRPFEERFRWPHLAVTDRDRRTGLAWYAYYAELERLFAAVPGLARARTEIAFIDLTGFRSYNNAFGMAAGDRALRLFAEELGAIGGSVAIRDGGDEFLVIGVPSTTGLADRLDTFRALWASRVAEDLGADHVVAPRILVATTRGDALVRAREELGRQIGELKQRAGAIDRLGIQQEIGDVGAR